MNQAIGMTQSELVAAMADPAFYPHAPESVEVRETNTSWVFLAGDLAYKVKRPVRFRFLDYSTLERRREMCHLEVSLNRRLAADAYLGVRSIVASPRGLALGEDGDDAAIEYAVEMRRLPEERSMAVLAGSGSLEDEDVDAVARRVARFHAGQPRGTVETGAVDALIGAIDETVEGLAECGKATLDEVRLGAARVFMASARDVWVDELRRRARSGSVRECHGDLRAEHVILSDDVVIFDCLEFDPSKRWIDVGFEVAFLAMDLEALGERSASRRLIAAYRAAGGDPGEDSMIAFLASYAAWIRALVACLRAADLGPARGAAAREEARHRLALGHLFAWRSRLPLIVRVTGLAASGKTTIASELAAISGLPHMSSDAVRKRLAGIDPNESAGPESYSPDFNRLTYRVLGDEAAAAIVSHGGAIVDATFRHAAEAELFHARLGAEAAHAVSIECWTSEEELLRRAAERSERSLSDADEPVVRRQIAERRKGGSREVADLRVRTDRPARELAAEVEAFLDSDPKKRGAGA
ncbi:MAG: AAA family ATPase [Solirubrobacterales bacterium]